MSSGQLLLYELNVSLEFIFLKSFCYTSLIPNYTYQLLNYTTKQLYIMSGTDYEFQGWLGKDEASVDGKMVWEKFEPKKWEEDDVDIQISHCGICGSDLHTLKSGWFPTPYRKSMSQHRSNH